jgi:hypothetical protein
VNVADVLDVLQAARLAAPIGEQEVLSFLGVLNVDAISILREWIFGLECAIDEVERSAEQMLGAADSAELHQAQSDLARGLGFTLDELTIIRTP